MKCSCKHRKKDLPTGISYIFGVVFVLFLIGLAVGVYFIEIWFPRMLTLEDESGHPTEFIGESAKRYLEGLTKIGPRVVGSYENEVLAVEYLRDQIQGIIDGKHNSQEIEFNLHVTSGSYYLGYKPYGSINAYANLQNIVVKLHGRDNSENSILVNAHFDTMTTSPGGSDDGIHCAVMLEVLRKLSQLPERPLHNIIFLFNGGEESNIQASHGFITQHKWAKEAKVVVNLEATGAGGKEILFQAGPEQAWLMNYYSNVPYPFAHVAGEEIFKSNIIPSDSDFRIFRDFGGLVGYDFAYIKDGYRYHTKYDGFSNIEDGRYQRTGANILQLIRDLSNAPEVTDAITKEDGAVFFDVFGLFIVSYGKTVELVVNYVCIALSILVFVWAIFDFKMGFSLRNCLLVWLKFFALLLEWIVACALVALVALFLGGVNRTMGWYKLPYLAFGLYSISTLFCCCGILLLVNKFVKKENITVQEDILLQSHLTRLIWTVVILVGTTLGVKSVYLFVIPVGFNIISTAIIHGFRLHLRTGWWIAVYIIGGLIPTMFTYSIGYHILSLFIPICGRFGTELNPEFIVGLFTMFLTIMSACFYIPLILLIDEPINILLVMGSCFIATIILVLTPVGFPYSGNLDMLAPQRFGVYHTQRIFHDKNGDIIKNDSGFHFLNMDYNSPRTLESYVTDIEKAVPLGEDCNMALFCGLPIVYSRDFEEIEQSVWIPTEPPIFDNALPEFVVKSVERLNKTVVRYNLKVTGPGCMDVYLSPKAGVEFLETNLNDFIPTEQPIWNGRPTMYILYVYGKEPEALEFYVDFLIPENWGDSVFDVAVTGKYIHDHTNTVTEHFKKFLESFPDFAVLTGITLGYYESWVI